MGKNSVVDFRGREASADPTLAGTILDRLMHNACRITFKGESM